MVSGRKAVVNHECSTSTHSVHFLLNNKKGIGPVVAISLLVVVSLVAVIGFSHCVLLRSAHFEQVQRVSKLVRGDLNV